MEKKKVFWENVQDIGTSFSMDMLKQEKKTVANNDGGTEIE